MNRKSFLKALLSTAAAPALLTSAITPQTWFAPAPGLARGTLADAYNVDPQALENLGNAIGDMLRDSMNRPRVLRQLLARQDVDDARSLHSEPT